jgi:hypothetical protein
VWAPPTADGVVARSGGLEPTIGQARVAPNHSTEHVNWTLEQGGHREPLLYSAAMRSPTPPGSARRTGESAPRGRAHDGAALCHPELVEVHCACGRTQRVHVHEPMAYAQACMDCVPGPTGVGTCPLGCYSLN